METDEAIVIRLADYSESSQVVTLFAQRSGQLRLLAKGLRRSTRQRFAVGLDLLERGAVSFARARGEAGLGTLGEWVQQDLHLGLRRVPATMAAGQYAAELVCGLTQEHDPHPGVYEALARLLSELSNGSAVSAVLPAVIRFQAGLLRDIGFAPQLRVCVQCQRPAKGGHGYWFNSHAGGLICDLCRGQVRDCAPMPESILRGATINEAPADWFGLLDYHLSHVRGGPFQSGRMLRESTLAGGALGEAIKQAD